MRKHRLLLLFPGKAFGTRRPRTIKAAAQGSDDVGATGTAAIALGALANPIVLLSDYTLFKTGRGLPEGPGGKPSSPCSMLHSTAHSIYRKVWSSWTIRARHLTVQRI